MLNRQQRWLQGIVGRGVSLDKWEAGAGGRKRVTLRLVAICTMLVVVVEAEWRRWQVLNGQFKKGNLIFSYTMVTMAMEITLSNQKTYSYNKSFFFTTNSNASCFIDKI